MTTLRTITGELRHTTGELLPSTTVTIVPVTMVSGDGDDIAILGDAFQVTSDGSGLVEFDAYEGDYDVEYTTSRGKAIRRARVDTDGPWTMGRFLGPAGNYTPSLVQRAEYAAAAASVDADAARAAVRTKGITHLPALYNKLANGGQISIAVEGDSWAGAYAKMHSFFTPLRELLSSVRNPQGPGWVNLDGLGPDDLPGATRSVPAARMAIATANPAICLGPDCTVGYNTVSTGATLTVTLTGGLTADSWVIGYEQRPAGGAFSYSVDGGAAVIVSTVGAAGMQFLTVEEPGASIYIATTTVGDGVFLAGVLPVIDDPTGFVLHRMGSSGAKLSDFANLRAGYFEAGLTAVAPDVILWVCSFVNDVSGGRTSAQCAADMATILSRIRTALPHTDVVILTGSETGAVGALLPEYEAALREVALADGKCGFLSLQPAIGAYASALTRGTMDAGDPAHPTAAGGAALALWVYNELLMAVGTEEVTTRLLLMPVDYDAGGDADAARPDYPEAQRILWRNVPSEPTNLGPNDWWEDPA